MSGATYDGASAGELAAMLDLPAVAIFESLGSTMDEAHALAEQGAPGGTLVLAETQEKGRGRGGRSWTSLPGSGIWLTLIERPPDASAIDVLSLRLGLRAAPVLDRFSGERVGVKWPNDLMLGDRKLAGILSEARWRDGRPEWVAIGVGVNVSLPPRVERAASLKPGTQRLDVLAELVPALRSGATARGRLSERELAAFAERDRGRGRLARTPRPGRVTGISADGALLIATPDGIESCAVGSLTFEEVDE